MCRKASKKLKEVVSLRKRAEKMPCISNPLTFTTDWANSADDKLVIFFLTFSKKQDLTFHPNCLYWRQFA